MTALTTALMTALKRLFGDGFRVFFLAAGLYALFAMAVWQGWLVVDALGGIAWLPSAAPPPLWHAHEMIFGYGAAALGGFFLTAVPNWTGAKSAPHLFIATVAGLWLAGRLALWASGSLPAGVVALADLAFVPVLAAKVLTQLIRRPKPQQMIFLVMLSLFWTANLMVHLEWLGWTGNTLGAGLRAGLLTLCSMIMVLGGRVTPGFTRNAMVRAGREDRLPRNPAPLAALSIAAALAQPVGYLLALPATWLAPLAVVAGLAGLVRVALWRGLWTWGQPILWTLHLSYAVNALGFVALGLAGLGAEPGVPGSWGPATWAIGSEIAALHLLGIGGVGGMTLSVMSRAVLGHTGRALVAPGPVALAYGLIPLAAALRWAGAELPAFHLPGVLGAGALWLLAYALFTTALWPVFWAPRQTQTATERPAP